MSNSTHRVNVVRIEEILPHSNADTLGIVFIGGYQCVIKKDAYKVGDLALYRKASNEETHCSQSNW
jgi:hypothetical protein